MKRVVYYDVNRYSSILNYCVIEYEDNFAFIADDKCILASIPFNKYDKIEEKIEGFNEADEIISGIKGLQVYLGIKDDLSVYQMYIQKYGLSSKNANGVSYLEMIKSLIVDNLGVNLKTGGLIVAIHKSKKTIRLTTCWFMIMNDGLCKSLGEDDYYLRENDYLYSNLEKVKLSISNDIVSSGLTLKRLKSFIFSENDKNLLETVFNMGGSSIPDWLRCEPLQRRLASMANLGVNTSFKTLEVIYTHQQEECNNSAKNLCNFLESSGKRLKLDLNENGLVFNRNMLKNFCTDKYKERHRHTEDYGVIIDCEGTESDGCREIGILIFFKDNNRIYVLKEYKAVENELTSVLSLVYKDYSKLIERYIPQSGISTYVYGANDRERILQSLSGRSSRGARRDFERKLKFIDVQPFIKRSCKRMDIKADSFKLKDIANVLSVVCVTPVHDPLCDCKTLFNVIAKLLLLDSNLLKDYRR